MAINVNSVLAGQTARTPALHEALATQRARPERDVAVPSTETDLPEGPAGAAARSSDELQPAAQPMVLDKAVEEANALAESTLRATNRSVAFNRHESSGRTVISISEEVNGETVTREIPPNQFLKLVDKLRDLVNSNEPPRGALVDLDI